MLLCPVLKNEKTSMLPLAWTSRVTLAVRLRLRGSPAVVGMIKADSAGIHDFCTFMDYRCMQKVRIK